MEAPTIFEFNADQESAIAKAVEWWNGDERYNRIFELTGYAGTGKTTTLKGMIERLDIRNIRFGAYTGKAARVINRATGYPASTIHSMIYRYVEPDKQMCNDLHERLYGESPETDTKVRQDLEKQLEDFSSPHFELLSLEDSPLDGVDLIALDECSMVGEELLEDLKSFGIPILALGDPGQLPPIGEKPALFQGDPDAHLDKIHRQAEGNPIIAASFKARRGIPWGMTDEPGFTYKSYNKFNKNVRDELICADQVLCGMNKTRYDLNVMFRTDLGFDITDPYPQPGERVCAWKNDKDKGIMNGDQGVVQYRGELYDNYIELGVKFDWQKEDAEPIKVHALRAYFEEYFEPDTLKRVKVWERRGTQELDFGYAVTVHKAQGSQWDHVVLVDDGLFRGWSGKAQVRRQYLYTAVTRAAEQFTCYKA